MIPQFKKGRLMVFPAEPRIGEAANPSPITADRVATLSDADILSMPSDDLAHVIREIRSSHLRDGIAQRLPYLERPVLLRLAFLTRRYCQHRKTTKADLAG
jgi:hypothetical protein